MKSALRKTVTTMALVLGAACLAAPAAAAPIDVQTTTVTLSPEVRASLRAAVDAARADDPGAFRDVQALVGRGPELDRKARGGKAPIALALASMGKRAVMPLAELAALQAPAGLSPAALTATRLDVVEALGILRDARTAPVLFALLEQSADAASTRTAAEAVARLDTDEAADRLVSALARAGNGERATSILSGMGMCHRPQVAKVLAERLASAPDEATARVVVKSLRKVASPWAWQTLARRDDEGAVRDVAGKALVSAYVRYEGETRSAAEKALVTIDDGRATRFVEAARPGASAGSLRALDGLAARLAASRAAASR